MPVSNRSLSPSGTLRGLEWETQPAQSAIIGLPVSYRTYRRDTPPALTVVHGKAKEIVTAVSTQLAGNPMMALCAVWVSHSRPRKVPEGGLQEAIPGYKGATPGGFMEKMLRTFPESTPYLFLARSQ